MPNALKSSKKLIEIFGYAAGDVSQEASKYWELGACPFAGSRCIKRNHDSSIIYGTCSVSCGKEDIPICPYRFYENDLAHLRSLAKKCFGNIPLIRFDEYVALKGRSKKAFVVALGLGSGGEVRIGQSLAFDWVLAHIESNRLMEYTGVELQSIDITGNYRDAWHYFHQIHAGRSENHKKALEASSAHGLNWANVHKRLIPQLLRKGLAFSRSSFVRKGIHFIVPTQVFDKFSDVLGEDLQYVSDGPKTITIQTYRLGPQVPPGQRRSLILENTVKHSLQEIAERFSEGGKLPSGDVLDATIHKALGLSKTI